MSLLFPRSRALFPEMRSAFRLMDDFQPTFNAFARVVNEANSSHVPSVNLEEDKSSYLFSAELPGAKKEDLNLSFGEDGRTLTLTGTIKRASAFSSPTSSPANDLADKSSTAETAPVEASPPSSDLTSWVSERFEGNFTRSIRLPTAVDGANARATYVDGVLNVNIPKKVSEGSKTVNIE